LRAVHLVYFCRLLLDVRQLGDARLHPVRQLVRRDARRGLGIARALELELIEVAHQIQRFAPRLRIHAVRVVREENRLSLRSELDALMDSGKESAAPAALAAVRVVLPRDQDDEGRQILVVAAQAVTEPRADAGA